MFVLGYPSDLGGADTELWHLVRLWRRNDLPVTLIPTWRAPADWRARCDAIGARTVEIGGPEHLADVPGLPGACVVSLCNGHLLRHAALVRRLGCRIAWAGCMTWLFPAERAHYRAHGPFDAYVFQSRYQWSRLVGQLAGYGVATGQCFHIPGALDADEFPLCPRPREPGGAFVVGRLARPDPLKWSRRTWQVYEAIGCPNRRARVMGWSDRVARKLGPPPDWAEVLPPCAEPPRDFLATLHCLMPINGGAAENWPRAGLEAMAAGVPIVAQDAWGWREMIEHEATGLLAGDERQLAACATRLAQDEALRRRLIEAARRRLVEHLAEPRAIAAAWRRLLDAVDAGGVRRPGRGWGIAAGPAGGENWARPADPIAAPAAHAPSGR